MKILAISFFVILLIGLSILFIKGKDVREIKTEIQISATPEEVWKVLTNINSWKEWNPTILLAEGTSSVNSKLNITINGNGKGDSYYQPIVIESSAPNNFRWRATMMANFIFRNDRVFTLESRDGGTYLTHKEEFKGMMVPIICGMLQEFVEGSLNQMNKSLKEKMETKI